MKHAMSVQESRSSVNDVENIGRDAEREGRSYGKSVTSYYLWKDVLNVAAPSLDIIYDYSDLLYEGKVLPKRLRIMSGSQEKDTNIIVENEIQVEVIGDFVPVFNAPSWRSFFKPPPKEIYEVAVPGYSSNSKAIQESWSKNFIKGYDYGVCFTLLEFKTAMESLSRDYDERFLFVSAERNGLVSSPLIYRAKTGTQVTDGMLLLNRKVTKVKEKETIFTNQSEWGGTE